MKILLPRISALLLVMFAFGAFGITAAYGQDAMAAKTGHIMAKTEKTMTDESQAMKAKAEVTIVELTQTPGAFTTESLELAAGQYQFKVANDGVDHEVGFVIQRAADKDADLMKTAIPEAFVTAPVKPGETQSTQVVTLTPGEYVYSCPLNPTPHYTITVK